jgi:beta-ribofuranosylaminobenzene 5'-phosphate synthase
MDFSRSVAAATLADPQAIVSVRAPGRLHLGFLDPAGSLGRPYGSLGLVVSGFETEIALSEAPTDQVIASGADERAEVERAAAHLQALRRHTGRHEPLRLVLLRVLPAHAGFGSGTQLALAIGRAFAQWHGLTLGAPLLAQWLGRGLRSGIGIAGFDHGGLLVDGGPAAAGQPAALLARMPLPSAWRVLVVQDAMHRGLSGADERHAIATLPPLPQAHAADICHQVLMRVLPGAACGEFAPFAAGITHIQKLLGRHFAAAQGGSAFTSAAVGRLIEWLEQCTGHGAAVGQSSWGPTGFAILPSQAEAEAVVVAARAAGVVAPSLALRIVSGRNTGASVVDRRVPARVR